MEDSFALETWLIDFGDVVIQKAHELGTPGLSTAEKAVYDLWAVDCSIRNGGDLEALQDLRPNALQDLAQFLALGGEAELAGVLADLAVAGEDCEPYYDAFPHVCRALQAALPGT